MFINPALDYWHRSFCNRINATINSFFYKILVLDKSLSEAYIAKISVVNLIKKNSSRFPLNCHPELVSGTK